MAQPDAECAECGRAISPLFAAYFYARTGKRLCGYACYVAHKERHAQKYADEADVLGGGGD